eukprot:TRINITY_DN14394_c0_g4_i1.p1 TRINITY_DN14394_c0_g4~~TRINITY_DN14394_c0_g4_i1.p1  ORF type:complete len:569 (-),score=39.58 TRINITY_DN14394_c0_g4_i1:147-1853(-)
MLTDDVRDQYPLLLQTLLDRGALVQPDNLIVTKTENGYRQVTFAESHARALRLASALTTWGVNVGDRVGTLMWNSACHVQCAQAISCLGGVLHTLNARLGIRDFGFSIWHAGERVILVDGALLGTLAQLDQSTLNCLDLIVCCGVDGLAGSWILPDALKRIETIDFEDFLGRGSPDYAWPRFVESTPHYICYTSGTTSAPKGVVYSHRSTYLSIMTSGLQDQYGITGSMVVSSFVPMFHILSWGVPFLALTLGARTVLTDRFTSSEHLLSALVDWNVEWSAGVPAIWQMLRTVIEKRGKSFDPATLRLKRVLAGGSAPSADVMEWYQTNFQLEFMQGWGMTETNPLGTNAKTVNTYKDLFKSQSERRNNLTEAGLPVPGMEFRIADSKDLDKSVPVGQTGELLVRGPLVITKYLKGEGADRFHNDWLVTGDIAMLQDGVIRICDRAKDFIKSGGEWISSVALEGLIVSINGISSVAVIGVMHPRWDERPVAIITLSPGSQLEIGREKLTRLVRDHCSESVAKFQLPDDVLVWDELPLNSTGKLDKKQIRERLASMGYVLPLTETKSRL